MPCRPALSEEVVMNTRRDFLKQAALGTAAFLAYPPARVLGANDRIRVGMIGVGNRGQDLLREAQSVGDVQLVAVADVYSRRRDEASKMVPSIRTFDDHRRLLDMKDLDAVIVASPLHTHARHFLDTLAAGKDLYAEKTMTWSIPEAEQCLAAARDSGRVVQIGLQFESSGTLADGRTWCIRSHGSCRRLTCRCQRRLTCRAASSQKRMAVKYRTRLQSHSTSRKTSS